MSWLYSQALVAACSVVNYSDGEQYAQLSVKPTQHKFWHNDKTMEASNLYRFGLTCVVLTESHGEELLMSYLADFHARTSAQQERARELTVQDRPCGNKWHELSVKYDLDTHSWKTVQCLFPEDLPWSSATLPRSGMMQNGCVYQQKNVAQITSAIESGFLLPTPVTKGLDGGSSSRKAYKKRLALLPTPCASDGTKASKRTAQERMEKGHFVRLPNALSTDLLRIGTKLNPEFPEWMMGWPIGWTDLKQSETDKSLSVWLQHFKC